MKVHYNPPMIESDITANQTLDCMASVCNLYVHTKRYESGRYSLEATDLETLEQYIVNVDNLLDAVIALGEQIGVDWRIFDCGYSPQLANS